MLLLQVWNHAELFAGTVASPGYVAFSLCAWVIVGTAAFVSSSLVNVTFRKSNCSLHVLVAWGSGACATTIWIPFLVLLFEYAVLDDKATLWFFHYIQRHTLCDVAINDMVCTSVGVARDARRRDGLGTNEYLWSA